MITEQKKCWDLLAQKFDRFQTLRNNSQDATTCKTGSANGINMYSNMQQCRVRLQGALSGTRNENIAWSQFKTGSRLAPGYIMGETIICDQLHKTTCQAFTADIAWRWIWSLSSWLNENCARSISFLSVVYFLRREAKVTGKPWRSSQLLAVPFHCLLCLLQWL